MFFALDTAADWQEKERTPDHSSIPSPYTLPLILLICGFGVVVGVLGLGR